MLLVNNGCSVYSIPKKCLKVLLTTYTFTGKSCVLVVGTLVGTSEPLDKGVNNATLNLDIKFS